jgi:hypothetical protein
MLNDISVPTESSSNRTGVTMELIFWYHKSPNL